MIKTQRTISIRPVTPARPPKVKARGEWVFPLCHREQWVDSAVWAQTRLGTSVCEPAEYSCNHIIVFLSVRSQTSTVTSKWFPVLFSTEPRAIKWR